MPRVLMFSERNADARKWQAQVFEFEDVIQAVDDVAMIAPPAVPTPWTTTYGHKVARKLGRWTMDPEPMVAQQVVTGEYDLFFCVFSFPEDMAHLHRLRGWRERCRKAVCFVLELYEPESRGTRPYLEALRHYGFDHVFLFNSAEKDLVTRLSGAPTEFMPAAVDAFRFSPYPDPPERVVDFYQYGRRSAVTQAATLELARRDGLFYLYEGSSTSEMPDYKAHRDLLASVMKRSRYFFAYRAGEDVARAARNDDLSSRFFEGTAGGAVLLGSTPRTDEYAQSFDWPDATITIPYEAHNLAEIVAELEATPRRLAEARLNNSLSALRRHDWGHRWARVLEVAGLAPLPRLTDRLERLEHIAATAEAEERERLQHLV